MRPSVTRQRVSDATAWICWLCGRTFLFWYRSRRVSGSISRVCRFRFSHARRNEHLRTEGDVDLRQQSPSVRKPDGNGCVNCLYRYPPQANPRSRSERPRPYENPTALTIRSCPQCLNLFEQIERKRNTSSIQPEVTRQPLRRRRTTQCAAAEAPSQGRLPPQFQCAFGHPKAQLFRGRTARPTQFAQRKFNALFDDLTLQINRYR